MSSGCGGNTHGGRQAIVTLAVALVTQLGCYATHSPRRDLPEEIVWLHAEQLSSRATISVGPWHDRRAVADIPMSLGLQISSDGRWALAGQTLVELDSGTTHDLHAVLEVGDACEVAATGELVSRGGRFHPDARALVYRCTRWGPEPLIAESRAWELELDRFGARRIEGDCVSADYAPTGELHVREHRCPGREALRSRLELADGSSVPLPPLAFPFSRERYLVVEGESRRSLRWVAPSDERVIVEDYDAAFVAPLGFGLTIGVRPSRALVPMSEGRWIEVSADGEVREPGSCAGVPFARTDGTDIIHCTDLPRMLVLDRATNTERSFPSLEGVSRLLFRGFDSESSWALAVQRAEAGARASQLYLLDPETFEAVVLPGDDPELGPVIDASFRYPAEIR